MKWSFQIASVAGIPIRVHATFFLLLVWIALANPGGNVVQATIFILALFACVVLHELGHGLVAQRYGIRVQDITLLPIGGVASLERMPENPVHEFWIAVAGPAVNVAIAAALYGLLTLSGHDVLREPVDMQQGSFALRLLVVNVFLVAFNMLPAFPMDGGRVLRALLAQRMEYVTATQIAARIGQGMALLFGFLGLLYNPFLLFIALFVYMGAEQEAAVAQMRFAFRGIPVKSAMVTDFRSVARDDPISQVLEMLLAGYQQDFPVLEDGRLIGVLTRKDLLLSLGRSGEAATVGQVMQTDFGHVEPSEMLDAAFQQLRTCRCQTLPVVQAGVLRGLLTAENISEFLMIEEARRRARARGATPAPTG